MIKSVIFLVASDPRQYLRTRNDSANTEVHVLDAKRFRQQIAYFSNVSLFETSQVLCVTSAESVSVELVREIQNPSLDLILCMQAQPSEADLQVWRTVSANTSTLQLDENEQSQDVDVKSFAEALKRKEWTGALEIYCTLRNINTPLQTLARVIQNACTHLLRTAQTFDISGVAQLLELAVELELAAKDNAELANDLALCKAMQDAGNFSHAKKA